MSKLLSIVAAAVIVAGPSSSSAEDRPWDVHPNFKNDEAANEISGVVCAGQNGEQQWCYVVNDEKKYVQLFSVDGRTLVPGDRVRILEKKDAGGNKNGEPDLEAVAYHDGFVYLSGSHGLSRKKGKADPSQFLVYRMPVERDTGKPTFKASRKRVAIEIEFTDKLREIIQSANGLSEFAEKPLAENGANIEGLGLLEDALYFGFRAPVTPKGAVILQIKIDRLFGSATQSPQTHFVNLGSGYGIRDIARLGNRFLLLAGASGFAELPAIVWTWTPGKPPRLLSVLNTPDGDKAEGLMVVNGTSGNTIKVLVVFDGQENGAPKEYQIPAQ